MRHDKTVIAFMAAPAQYADDGVATMEGIAVSSHENNNTTLDYRVSGSGSPIVLIHDLGSSLDDWHEQVPALAAHATVITVSLRGFGRTPAGDGRYPIARHAADVIGVLDELGIDSADVLGLGLGAAIAYQAAVDYPQRLRSLIVVNGLPCYDLEYWHENLRVMMRLGMAAPVGMRRIARFVAARVFPEPRQRDLRRCVFERLSSNSRATVLAALRALSGWSVLDRIGEIDVPVLIVAGDRDFGSLGKKRELASHIPQARFEIIENSRHCTPLDQPDRLNAVVLDFLAGLERTRTTPVGIFQPPGATDGSASNALPN